MKKFIATLSALPLITVSATYLMGLPAQALPSSQGRCSGADFSITAANGFQPIPGLGVSVNNTTGTTKSYVVRFVADTFVENQAEVRIAYAIDGGPPQEGAFGPKNFANFQQFSETRATMAIIPLGSGFHTVQPFWRVSGAPNSLASIEVSCITIEGNTR